MKELTPAELKKSDDWRDLYLNQGPAMLALAVKSLAKPDTAELGLKIVAEAFFEEDDENPEQTPSLSKLDFSALTGPLTQLLAKKDFAGEALYGLRVCALEGAKLSVPAEKLEPFLDKAAAKSKVNGMPLRSIAFRAFLHRQGQQGRMKEVISRLKGNADFKKVLFEELTYHACAKYDLSPFITLAEEGLRAKGESAVREAVDVLWKLVKAGADISASVPFLFENLERLAGFTSAPQLLAGHYLKSRKFEALEEWLKSPTPKSPLNAYRGILNSSRNGISGREFAKRPGMLALLQKIADDNGLSTPEEIVGS